MNNAKSNMLDLNFKFSKSMPKTELKEGKKKRSSFYDDYREKAKQNKQEAGLSINRSVLKLPDLTPQETQHVLQKPESTGSAIKKNIKNVLSQKYGELDTRNMFDDIDDKDVENNISTAENTIKTNVDRGVLSQNTLRKLPNLRDGLALSYAAANKGKSRAATRAREAAYTEGDLQEEKKQKPEMTKFNVPTTQTTQPKMEVSDTNKQKTLNSLPSIKPQSASPVTKTNTKLLSNEQASIPPKATDYSSEKNTQNGYSVTVNGVTFNSPIPLSKSQQQKIKEYLKDGKIDANEEKAFSASFKSRGFVMSNKTEGANHVLKNMTDEQINTYKSVNELLENSTRLDLNQYFSRFQPGINYTLQILDVINTNINKTANNVIGAKKIVDAIYGQSYDMDKGFPIDNFIHNSKISLDSTGALEGNYIEHQSKLKDYKYGTKDIDYGGCGIIAIYNVLQGLGKPKNFASLIYENENSALLKGLLGTSPASIENSLKDYGFDVLSDYSGINEKTDVSQCDAVIHFYFRKKLTAHYVAGISNGDGTFCFYNSDSGKTTPMTWKEYFEDAKAHTDIAYSCIYKIKKKG